MLGPRQAAAGGVSWPQRPCIAGRRRKSSLMALRRAPAVCRNWWAPSRRRPHRAQIPGSRRAPLLSLSIFPFHVLRWFFPALLAWPSNKAKGPPSQAGPPASLAVQGDYAVRPAASSLKRPNPSLICNVAEDKTLQSLDFLAWSLGPQATSLSASAVER